MKLSRAEVEHIADLARLTLTQDEIIQYQEQLSDILNYAEKLQAVDTSSISPTTSVLPPKDQPLRKDIPGETLRSESLFRNAPDIKNNQFKVPPVFGGNDE
ncbi:MAG: Asp-tRNA(Asn)/Glu-tRNA(Gln) amidotransferase subunit GatC [Anaerolineae bacterium]|jgi:aspartyl-tRNA(Asn)/glutamyl-tRNA(Gln) amidotransferase subunit C|nr:Asp-tRNA(Asn)/Glu-tRNA(Gln) amidotransferase subunit GatC [Anaerolineae bacterium]